MTNSATAIHLPNALRTILVVVADAQRARILRGAGGVLFTTAEAYAATPDVRSLDQAPDISRNSVDATPRVPAEDYTHFSRDVANLVREGIDERPGQRLIVIAPALFALSLKIELGKLWPVRAGDVIHRDQTALDENGLTSVIQALLAAHP